MTTQPAPEFDRAAEMRSDLGFLESQLDAAGSLFLPLSGGQVFVRDGSPVLLSGPQVAEQLNDVAEIVWLGRYAGSACFALDLGPAVQASAFAALGGASPAEPRALMAQLPAGLAELVLFARALVLWHSRHRFCSVCGHPSRPRQGGHQRVCAREQCRAEHFPRTDPCVLVLVCDGERCLLGRSKGWPAGMFSALAGFVEPGETLEAAVAREVREEVGVEVDAPRYVTSQPWPFPASLMIGFVAQARTLEIRVDEHELEAARWVTRQELSHPKEHGFFVPPKFALAGQIIAAFVDGTLR